MSAAMDLSSLKIEATSVHSSPHRTPIGPSPIGSPCDNNIDIKPAFSTINFGAFTGSKSRVNLTSVRVGSEETDFEPLSKLPKSPQISALNKDSSNTSSPVIANFLTNDDSENSQNRTNIFQNTAIQSPEDFFEKLIRHEEEEQEFHRQYYAVDKRDNLSDVVNGETKLSAPGETRLSATVDSRLPTRVIGQSRFNQRQIFGKDSARNGSIMHNSPSAQATARPDIIARVKNITSHIENNDKQCSEDNLDHIACITCSKIYANLQSYSEHTCSISQDRLQTSSSTGKTSPQNYLNEVSTSDTVSFQGKIILNRSGSAYVIEDSILGRTFPLQPDSIVLDEAQKNCNLLPKISSVTIFPKSQSSIFSNQTSIKSEQSECNVPIFRFLVFELGTAEGEEALSLILTSKPQKKTPSQPVLMCFSCKLVFRKQSSILHHAVSYHDVVLTADEEVLLCEKNVSVISYSERSDEPAKLSLLYPIFDVTTASLGNEKPCTLLKMKMAEFLANKGCLRSDDNMPLYYYSEGITSDQGFSSVVSQENSPVNDVTAGFKLESCIGSGELSSSSVASKHTTTKDECTRRPPPAFSPESVGDLVSAKNFFQTSRSVASDSSSPLRLRISPSTISLACVSSPSSSTSYSLVKPSFTTSSTSALPMPPLVLSSISSAMMNHHINLSSGTSSFLQPNDIQMPNFLRTCELHSQGRPQGLECQQCDIMLNSSISSGGHMTITHSRNSCKTLKCPKCNWHYKYHETLEIHMKEKHPDSDAQCVYCMSSQIHPRLARGESYSCGFKPYRCEVCNYSTTTKGNLSIHMQSDKHINNIQDLAAGNPIHKTQLQQPPSSQPLPVTKVATFQNNTSSSSFSPDESQLQRAKQKQSFRCSICGYETSVARNLRIHMTSEKHTQKMLVMTQNMSRLHQDLAFHQASQINQLIAINDHEQGSPFSTLGHHLQNNIFSLEDNAMVVPIPSSSPSSSFDMPLMLSTESESDECDRQWTSTQDATSMFQCCICYKYGSDNVDNVHSHIQLDRTKSTNSDTHVSFNNGTYYCNLCSYKTHLKANFHLHCKTDKHLQKLQTVNHVLEGGPENEWRLSHAGSPIQICCNACSFHANSTHKMQLHLNSIQHGTCAQIFRHLQLLDRATRSPAPGNTRYYQCSLCAVNVLTKQKLVIHSRTSQHIQREHSLLPGQVSIFDIYLLKEATDGEDIKSDEDADESIIVDSEDAGTTCTFSSSKNSNISTHVTAAASLSPSTGNNITTTTTTTTASSSCVTTTNCSIVRSDPSGDNSPVRKQGEINESGSDNSGLVRTLALASKSPGSSSNTEITSANGADFKSSTKCHMNESISSNCGAKFDTFGGSQPAQSLTPSTSGAGARNSECILCPLCRHECSHANLLAEHLVKEHNVVQEGIEKILSMVDMPSSAISSMPSPGGSSASSLSSSSCTGSIHTETVSPLLSLSSNTISSAEKTHASADSKILATSSKDLVAHSSEIPENNPGQKVQQYNITKKPNSTNSSSVDMHVTSHNILSTSSSIISTSSSSTVITSPALVLTYKSAPGSSTSNQNTVPENMTLSIKDKEKEINLERLEAEHANLLMREGIDLALQEKLDKEFEEMLRCQTCSTAFSDIERLYHHQNELGHLELKQTPRGPGYLCWKAGCNQYFKTASTLQVHFKEIHIKRTSAGVLSQQELGLYKFNCGQCSFCFKSLEAMQRHTMIHLIQSVTQCRICSRSFNSVRKIEKHLENEHSNLGLSDINLHIDSIETNARLLFDSAGYKQFLSGILLTNGSSKPRNGISNIQDAIYDGEKITNGLDRSDNAEEKDEFMYENDNVIENCNDKQFLEDYLNNPSMAEDHYRSSGRIFKCHSCKMGFTSQLYLFAHNKTSQHRRNEQADRSDEVARPYKCDICRESFAQKSILLVHYNSASHLHKLKQQTQAIEDSRVLIQTSSHLIPHSMPSYPVISMPSSTTYTSANDAISDSHNGNNVHIKPYRCNVCRVSYNNQPSFEIHLRSVGHKTKSSKLGELIQTGQVDVNQALIEHPDPRTACKQQAQIIADMIHQQATAQAASNAATAFFNLQGLQGLNAMPGEVPQAQMDAYFASINLQFNKETSKGDNTRVSSSREYLKEKLVKTSSTPEAAHTSANTALKDEGKTDFPRESNKVNGILSETKISEGKNGRKDDDLPPHFHAPVIARPRGFMGRFKPQLYKSLLENFGFECVMLFNEENTRKYQDVDVKGEGVEEDDDMVCEKMNDEGSDAKDVGEGTNDNKITGKDEKNETPKEKTEAVKCDIDLTEVSKQQCRTCHKHFSNVWVLKNHEEDIHSYTVSPEVIEEFGQQFKKEWIKNLPRSMEQESVLLPQLSPNPLTPTAATSAESIPTTKDMPPPKPPIPPQLPSHFELSQLLPFMSMNLLPMHLSVNLVNLGLQNSLMPSMMLPTMDLSQGFLPHLPPPSVSDSPTSMSAQQQFHAAAAAAAAVNAQNQKRVRTRISDDQLKVLRQYFDINNSPSEEQVNKMADQTGLPQKVIKHWFRNTLFKERQRNKDSPYNFNNPPSTSIDLDEYDRTGKIPEIKLEPEDEYDRDITPVPDVKKENPSTEESAEDKHEHDNESFETTSLKLDLTPKTEANDEGKKDQESHSNSSSPFMLSIPSTPTASAPATPTPSFMANSMSSANPLAFTLDTYAANMARIEAATFQSLGKRANRTRFTDYQIKTLQDYFERNAYPKDDELEHLSKILGLSARVIVVWFQNARQKARKTYENQPSNEGMKESLSPFQRTPGLNYQCKKCNSVFQRYYELIKHQKHSCVGESNNNNNNKPVPSMTEDDSNFSYSNDDSNFSDRQSTPALGYRDKDLQPRSQPQEPHCVSNTPTSKTARASSTPLTTSPHSSTSSSIPLLKCDKCPSTFSRFDTWQEHQKVHSIVPTMFVPFSSSSAFGTLQSLAHQEDNSMASAIAAMATPNSQLPSMLPVPMSTSEQPSAMRTTPTSSLSLSPSSKRKTDSEDDSGEQPKDKRLRTTILPEQLDYLYQQYQIDCNPSRKQLEHIAATVNLKKRVVQVWFQNTRARERKGHYRAHQQLINKRCPFCRALFRAKSALESHLATKHPEEVAKGDINIDLIPDALIEPPSSQAHTSLSGFSGQASSPLSTNSMLDINKFLPPRSSATMPNYMNLMSTPSGFNLPFPGSTPDVLNHAPFEDNFFKKYLNDLVTNMTMRQEHPLPQSHILSTPVTTSAHSTPKPHTHQSPGFSQSSRPFDAHKMKSTPQPAAIPSNDDAPLDLSKPARVKETAQSDIPSRGNYSSILDFPEQPKEVEYLRRLNSMDDTFSETHSEMADHDYTNDIGNSPPSPSHTINGLNHNTSMPCSIGKRYRTQMSAVQVKVMKHLFQDYKTPTMAECELLGQEIGLAKRVVQVWFQNARAKEKKAKLNSGKPFNPETDFPKTPEECKLCSYKYTHKVTVQDHIFTKTHIDRVKAFLNAQGFQENDQCSTSFSNISQTQSESDHTQKMWDDSVSNMHMAQLHAMGMNSTAMGFPLGQDERNMKSQEKELPPRKEKKLDGVTSKEDHQQSQAVLEMAMNAQMLSALGGYMPGLEPAYLPYMYSGLPGYFPGMGMSMIQPGLIPEHMLAYDPLAFGTPLALLQIPAAAIQSISEKVKEAGAVLARYTQDCQALADLHNIVSAADLTVAAEATLDVGYICKKCHMVYPARDSCVAHQHSICMASKPSFPNEFEPIMKLEQVQYECRACKDRFSTILEFKSHCLQESHKQKLMKYKAREAARHDAAGSPSSSAPYSSSISKVISLSPPYSSKPLATSPPSNNNNNNSRIHNNNNQVTSPDADPSIKPVLVPSPAPICKKPPTPSSSTPLFRNKHTPAFTELADINRLNAQ